jgi:hypothetical protein
MKRIGQEEQRCQQGKFPLRLFIVRPFPTHGEPEKQPAIEPMHQDMQGIIPYRIEAADKIIDIMYHIRQRPEEPLYPDHLVHSDPLQYQEIIAGEGPAQIRKVKQKGPRAKQRQF